MVSRSALAVLRLMANYCDPDARDAESPGVTRRGVGDVVTG
jgi:hypothetical protein